MCKSLPIVLVLAFSRSLFAQQVHELSFSSSGNVLELTVVNTSVAVARNICVVCSQFPSWIHLPQKEQRIALLKGGEETSVIFMFSVEKTAPVNTPQTLTFTVTGGNGERWTKEVGILVKPPEKFELFQNYPNPFNPVTTIQVAVPRQGFITVRVFDILGREVAVLVEGELTPGIHLYRFDGASLPSGTYIYVLTAGETRIAKKMMFLK